MNRFSVVYRLGMEYHQMGCSTLLEARALLDGLLGDESQTPIGIYDAKTELFEWEPTRQQFFSRSCIKAQGRLGEQIIALAQALRVSGSVEPAVGQFPESFNSNEKRGYDR